MIIWEPGFNTTMRYSCVTPLYVHINSQYSAGNVTFMHNLFRMRENYTV